MTNDKEIIKLLQERIDNLTKWKDGYANGLITPTAQTNQPIS